MKNVTFETSYKFKKWRKRNRIKNHKLLRRYPFLRAKDWHGNPIRGDDFTFLDDIPKGWVKLFGIQMCEDLRNSLLRTGDFRHYGVDQAKEKYGSLRWYHYGFSDEAERIISDYEQISERTCVGCGKFPSPLYTGGWVSAYCPDCYSKFLYNRDKDLEKVKRSYIEKYDKPFEPTYIIKHWSKDGDWTEERDVTEILNRLKNSKPKLMEGWNGGNQKRDEGVSG